MTADLQEVKRELLLGWNLDKPRFAAEVQAEDVRHHTAILAQSGAGKSFFLGRLIEEILLKTESRVIVLDSNGDFRRVHQVEGRAWQEPGPDDEPDEWAHGRLPRDDYGETEAFRCAWTTKVTVEHLTAEGPQEDGEHVTWGQMKVAFGRLDETQRATILGLSRSEEPGAMELLRTMHEGLRQQPQGRYSPHEALDALLSGRVSVEEIPQEASWRVRQALEDVHLWPIWLRSDEGETADIPRRVGAADSEWRLLVLDLPSLGDDARQRTVAVASAVDALWASARKQWDAAGGSCSPDKRVPLFLVIDEAHNFAPSRPADPLAERVAEDIHRLAAEGRKYGLFLIAATQRPAKMREGLLEECENGCLLRLQSGVDHETARDTWGIPLEQVARTRHFKTGDGLLFGQWVPSTTHFHAAWRRTKQGGADLDADHWANPVVPVKNPLQNRQKRRSEAG